MTRAEFGWLYYPHTRFTSRPYELSPALVWFHLENATSKGMTRLLRMAARPIAVHGHSCDAEPQAFGPGFLWSGCRVRFSHDGDDFELALFGPTLERDGRFRFTTFANEL
jgi:hypothetical protein